MVMPDVAMLAMRNSRSRAYLQEMIKVGLFPAHVIFLEDHKTAVPGCSPWDEAFDFTVVFDQWNISYEIVPSLEVNGSVVLDKIAGAKQKYFIYAGPGGVILRKPILSLGKQFLHVHAGRLPAYRGSTTIYYQMLCEEFCTATALILNE